MARENPTSGSASTKITEEESVGLLSSPNPWSIDTSVNNRIRWSSAQSKRVAASNDRLPSMVPHQHPKKRAALTNLTNQRGLETTPPMVNASVLARETSKQPHVIQCISGLLMFFLYDLLILFVW